jgi:hypothetical protein
MQKEVMNSATIRQSTAVTNHAGRGTAATHQSTSETNHAGRGHAAIHQSTKVTTTMQEVLRLSTLAGSCSLQ